jgi:hypothetical protein
MLIKASMIESSELVIRRLRVGSEKIRRLKAEELVDDSVVKRLNTDGTF